VLRFEVFVALTSAKTENLKDQHFLEKIIQNQTHLTVVSNKGHSVTGVNAAGTIPALFNAHFFKKSKLSIGKRKNLNTGNSF
jgi:hypothetical protein